MLRQYLDYGGWYNSDKIYFKKVRDINFVVTVSSRQQNKELICERFGWHLSVVGVINLEGCHIEQIYRLVLGKRFMSINRSAIPFDAPEQILKASMEFFKRYNDSLKPSPQKFLFKIN